MTDLEHTDGNAQVVDALERLLARARQGKVSYLAAVALEEPDAGHAFFGGVSHRLKACFGLVEKLGAAMSADVKNRVMPPRDPNLSADRVCYDVPGSPLSFDFLPWLIDAEMTRIREGAPAPLKVAFWFGREGKTGLAYPARQQMFVKVVRPMLGLVGAVEDDGSLLGRFKELFVTRDIVQAAVAGEPVPRLRASEGAAAQVSGLLAGVKPVVITLREAEHWPHRNSNVEAWLQFADWLKAQGELVIFVRDTAKAMLPLSHPTYPAASIDIDIRTALYAAAKAHLGVSNGPATIPWFLDIPSLLFLDVKPDDYPYQPNTARFLREQMGLEVGGQFPWLRPDQRFVWAPDNFHAIVDAWREWIAPRVSAAA